MLRPWLPRPKAVELLLAAAIVGGLLFAAFWLVLGHAPPILFLIAAWGVVMGVVLAAAFRRKARGEDRDLR